MVPSPSEDTKAGREVLTKDPDSPGSLGIAISEAVEDAVSRDDTKYSLGSVLNHVLLHQTVVGLEAKKQLEIVGDYPDILVGCIGGGSNFAGFFLPFMKDKLDGMAESLRVICVEPQACPSVTRGPYIYDFGDEAGLTPLLRMYTLGHTFVPLPIHAGGLRYHGMAPIICALYDHNLVEAVAVHQNPVFEAAVSFARAEGFVVAPEPPMQLRWSWTKPSNAGSQGNLRLLSSITVDTATSTWQPMRPTWQVNSRTINTLRRRSGKRWNLCPR